MAGDGSTTGTSAAAVLISVRPSCTPDGRISIRMNGYFASGRGKAALLLCPSACARNEALKEEHQVLNANRKAGSGDLRQLRVCGNP